MDVAYDRITDEALAPADDDQKRARPTTEQPGRNTLNSEFQEAFNAVSASPWGATLGGWFGEAKKQGQAFYTDLQKEASQAQGAASKHISGLREEIVKRTNGLNLGAGPAPVDQNAGDEVTPAAQLKDQGTSGQGTPGKTELLSKDIVKEAGSLVASLRHTAAARLKDLQRAEDAADEALLKFGSNIRDYLREAVIITAPTDEHTGKPRGRDAAGNEVLFETQEPGTGRKIFHTTRLDAQLHALHSNVSSFTEDPATGDKWEEWTREFDIEKRTDVIAGDLDKYGALRTAMEKLVPEKVEYKTFWMRYYFLRSAVEEEEKRRKEVLKGAAAGGQETIGWDDDDDEGEEPSSTPNAGKGKFSASTTTLNAPAASTDLLKPKSPRRSNEEESKSVADSDASYDMVSGATSRAPGSPKESKKGGDESDDDWE